MTLKQWRLLGELHESFSAGVWRSLHDPGDDVSSMLLACNWSIPGPYPVACSQHEMLQNFLGTVLDATLSAADRCRAVQRDSFPGTGLFAGPGPQQEMLQSF